MLRFIELEPQFFQNFLSKNLTRAANDEHLIEILNNMREYQLTSKQIDTLYSNNSSNYEKEFSIFKAVHLCKQSEVQILQQKGYN